MANYTINIDVFYDELNGGTGYSTTGPEDIEFLQAGDRVYVDVRTFDASDTTGVTLAYASTAIFTSGGMIGDGEYRTVKSGVANGTSRTMNVYKNTTLQNGTSTTVIVQQSDTTPNPFGLTNITDVDPKALILAHTFTVQGINRASYATISTSSGREAYFTINNEVRARYAGYVEPNNTIRIYVEAEHDYNELVTTIDMTIGTVTESFTVTTRKYPLPEQIIYMGISAPQDIRLKADVATFFGGENEPLLTHYLRGAGQVPSIQENEHVPTSPPILLTDLYDTASALYFIYKPPNKIAQVNTLDGAKTLQMNWHVTTEYNVGYGKLAEYLEYRYEFVSDDPGYNQPGDPTDVTIHSSTGNPGTWSQNNGNVWLRATSPQNTENWYHGTLTIYCRNAIDNTGITISKTVEWQMMFYGP